MFSNYSIIDDVLGLKNLIDGYFEERTTDRFSSPLVNLSENGDHIIVEAVAPGVRNEDIHLELLDTTLQLTIKRTKEQYEAPYIRRERNFGSFSKSIRLPFRVDPEKISAILKDGILTVELEKSEDAKPKKIMIN